MLILYRTLISHQQSIIYDIDILFVQIISYNIDILLDFHDLSSRCRVPGGGGSQLKNGLKRGILRILRINETMSE